MSACKELLTIFSRRKAESNFREVTDERHLKEILQELYKFNVFSESRFIEEFEMSSIRLFNQWLHQQHQASMQVTVEISAILQELAQKMELESEDKQSVKRFLNQLKECQNECCVISEKYCKLFNKWP